MEAVSPDRPVLRFGNFEADLASGELRKHGIRIHVQEQPFKVLSALVERPGQVISREELVRRLWPDGTFVDYDRGLNAAINRLRQVLTDSAENPRYVETVAGHGYRFIAPVEITRTDAAERCDWQRSAVPPRSSRGRTFWSAGAVALVALVAGMFLLRRDLNPPALSFEPVPMTSYEGSERQPSFSPDGTQLAFSWDGPGQDNYDIYVKATGSGPPLRLTTDPAADTAPAWSPDGRYVAFVRAGRGIYIVPPTGGFNRRLVPPPVFSQLSWSPDGKIISFARPATGSDAAGIFSVPVEGGAPTRITTAERGVSHRSPAASADGRRMAFASCVLTSCEILVLRLPASAREPARRVAHRSNFVQTLAWTADDRALVFDELVQGVGYRLWRVSVRGGTEPQLLSFARWGSSPAISRTRGRMAYSQNTGDHEIWSLEHGREPVRSRISSTFIEACPQFSHDGNRIAFLSARSGNAEIWVANLDGTDAVQLTNSKASGNPRWSPDDKWIVYETQSPDGGWDIRMIDPTGGPPIGVVHHPANEMQPSFSQDGKWIYFRSNRGGTDEVYRVPFGGGDAVQLTDHGGIAPVESADGKTLFYSMGSPQCEYRMFARPLAGGPERRILDSFCVAAITGQGIYFIPKRPAGQTLSVWFLDSATGETREFRKIMGRLHTFFGMTVSPDGRIILVAASAQSGADLHLVENFR